MQAKLDVQIRRPKNSDGRKAHAVLTGRIFDGDDQPMSPAFSYGRGGKLYRYYVSAPLQQGAAKAQGDSLPRRISAALIEGHLAARLANFLPQPPEQPLDLVLRLEIRGSHVAVFLPIKILRAVMPRLGSDEVAAPDQTDPNKFCLTLPFQVSTSRGRTELVAGVRSESRSNKILIAALRAAHALTVGTAGTSIIEVTPTSTYQRRLAFLAFLAPDIQDAILTGHQPPRLNLADLMDHDLPVLWSDQRKMLGWAGETSLV